MTDYVDAHVHFWDRSRHTYEWLASEPALAGPYTLAEYRVATADDPPSGFLFVQAGTGGDDGAAEARWVHEMCEGDVGFAGMVVWAPAELGADAMGRHLDALDLPTVRGVRRLIQADPPGFCTQRSFVEAVASLAPRDLVFDVCILPHHLDDAIELAAGAPDTRLVLDHLGKPDIAGGGHDDWHAGFRELAAHDNVWCKLSGLVTEADAASWTVDDLRPVVDAALAAFGPPRLLWGSDWPVVTLAATHRRWRDATDTLLGELTASERDAIRSGTAIDVYGLAEETT